MFIIVCYSLQIYIFLSCFISNHSKFMNFIVKMQRIEEINLIFRETMDLGKTFNETNFQFMTNY